MAYTISPWQRVALSLAALAILTYASTSAVAGHAFFLKAVVGVVFAVVALTPPGEGASYFPVKSWRNGALVAAVPILIAVACIANPFWVAHKRAEHLAELDRAQMAADAASSGGAMPAARAPVRQAVASNDPLAYAEQYSAEHKSSGDLAVDTLRQERIKKQQDEALVSSSLGNGGHTLQ